MNILRCFSLLSGMSINIQKSHLLGVGIPDNCVAEAAKSIGCLIMKAPFKYLGILVGDNMSSKKACSSFQVGMNANLSHDNPYGTEYIQALQWLEWSCSSAAFHFDRSSVITEKLTPLKSKVSDPHFSLKIRSRVKRIQIIKTYRIADNK
ncbi:hypothetical protein Tco_0312677 [Tanacetum coccineum]